MEINLEFSGLSITLRKFDNQVGVQISDKNSSVENINEISYLMPIHESKELIESINLITNTISNEIK